MTIDHEDLIAELRACVARGSYSGGGYLYVEVAPEDATAAADALEQHTTRLREAEELIAKIDAEIDQPVTDSEALVAIELHLAACNTTKTEGNEP